jgi:hypothetical protein
MPCATMTGHTPGPTAADRDPGSRPKAIRNDRMECAMTELNWHAERADLHGLAQLDREPADEGIDLVAVRRYRLNSVRSQMADLGVDTVILSDPVNIRYATGARNMQVFSVRNAPSRYLLLTRNHSISTSLPGACTSPKVLRQSRKFAPPRRPASSPQVLISPRSSVLGPRRWHRRSPVSSEIAQRSASSG